MAKILLCDDSKSILLLFDKKLGAAGHEVVGKAKDGFECVKLYNEVSCDIVLLDITMPNRDGREALEDLMKINPKAKVIMVSALQEPEVIAGCLKTGAKGFVSKSSLYDENDFKSQVLQLIDNVLKAA